MEMAGDSEMCSSNQFQGTYGQEISEILFGEIVNTCDIKYLPVRHFATNLLLFFSLRTKVAAESGRGPVVGIGRASCTWRKTRRVQNSASIQW